MGETPHSATRKPDVPLTQSPGLELLMTHLQCQPTVHFRHESKCIQVQRIEARSHQNALHPVWPPHPLQTRLLNSFQKERRPPFITLGFSCRLIACNSRALIKTSEPPSHLELPSRRFGLSANRKAIENLKCETNIFLVLVQRQSNDRLNKTGID